MRFLRFLKEAMSQNSLRNLFYECFIVGENPFNTFDCTGRQSINFFDVLKWKQTKPRLFWRFSLAFLLFFFKKVRIYIFFVFYNTGPFTDHIKISIGYSLFLPLRVRDRPYYDHWNFKVLFLCVVKQKKLSAARWLRHSVS